MATLYLKSAGGNYSSANTWSNVNSAGTDNSGPPTAADDVICELASGNLTGDAAMAARSFDCQGGTGSYAGTFTHNAGFTLSIGDGTAGLGNRALRFSSFMTYTLGSASTSAILFKSTSATQQTITTAGKTLGPPTFNATSNGSWQFSDAFSCGTQTLTLTKGSLDTNGQTVTAGNFDLSVANTRSLTLGSSSIPLSGTSSSTWSAVSTNLTLSAASSTITLTGAGAGFVGHNSGSSGGTYGTVSFTGDGTHAIAGANTFGALTFTGTASKTCELTLSNASQIVSGAFTSNGNSATNRNLIKTGTLGTTYTITAGTVTVTNSDFKDITGAGAGSWDLSAITGKSGDCGGNSGITFTTGATQTATGTASFTWSTHGWTSRVPLPQDDVVINNAFVAGRTVTLDMPRAGKSINWTGATGSPTWDMSTASSFFGSATLLSGISLSGTSAITFEGRGSFTLTSAGIDWGRALTFAMVGGTMTLQDALSQASYSFSHTDGTVVGNGFNVTSNNITSTSGRTRGLTLGTGTWTYGGTGTIWSTSATNLTIDATGSTISLSNTSASAKTFAGAGKTYNDITIATGGAGAVTFTGANTIARILVTGGSTKSIVLPGSTTTTLTGTQPFPSGAVSNLITFTASSGSATVSAANLIDADYVSLTNIVGAGAGIPFYAGTHSTDGGGNTNWSFTSRSSDPTASVSDSVTITEDVTLLKTVFVSRSDDVTLTESIGAVVILLSTVSDAVTVSESIGATQVFTSSASDTVTLTESVSRLLTIVLDVSDSVGVTESVVIGTGFLSVETFDAVSASESLAELLTLLPAGLSDAVTVTESALLLVTMFVSLNDAATISENVGMTQVFDSSVFDAATVSESIQNLLTMFVSANEVATLTESISATGDFTWLALVVDNISITDVATFASGLLVFVYDTVTMSDATFEPLIWTIESGATPLEGVKVWLSTGNPYTPANMVGGAQFTNSNGQVTFYLDFDVVYYGWRQSAAFGFPDPWQFRYSSVNARWETYSSGVWIEWTP